MTALLAGVDTLIPDEADTRLAVESSRLLASAKPGEELHVRLENGTEIPLPKGVYRLLSHLLVEMGSGNAVTLVPCHAEFTTQEAADYLNVSRPHLIKLLGDGVFPFTKIGSHRRIKFKDLTRYKTRRDVESEAAQRELAALAQEMEEGGY